MNEQARKEEIRAHHDSIEVGISSLLLVEEEFLAEVSLYDAAPKQEKLRYYDKDS